MPPAATTGRAHCRASRRTNAKVQSPHHLRGIEHTAMTAGFHTLSDDQVDTCLYQQLPFGGAGCAGREQDAGALERIDAVLRWQSEVKADHARARVQ